MALQDDNDKKKKQESKEEARENKLLTARHIAFATSTGIMIIAFVLIGFYVGRQFGETGTIVGVIVGTLLGIISFASDLYLLIRREQKNEEKKKKEKKQ